MSDSRRARITLAADDKTGPAFAAIKQRFGGLQGEIDGLGQTFGGLAGTIGTVLGGFGLGALVTGIANGLDKFNDLKDATGASIENLSALEDVALRTGTSFETVGDSLVKLNQALNTAKGNNDVAQVLTALGLSAESLRQADPAEALLQTAQALEQFAADGSRARAEQILFGRSLRDIAPFLKDLAETGALNATVTTEQADAAERFNKQLFAVQATATGAGRAIANEVLPVLIQIGEAFQGAGEQGERFSGIASVVRVVLETFTVVGAYVADTFRGVGREIGAIAAQIVALARFEFKGFTAISDALREDNARAKVELDQFVQRVLTAGKTVKDAGGGRGFINPTGGPAPSLGAVGGAAPAGPNRAVVNQFDAYIARIRDAQLATLSLSAEEQARIDIALGKLGKLTAAQNDQAIAAARQLDQLKQSPVDQITEAVLTKRQREIDQLNGLVDSSTEAQFDRLVTLTQSLTAEQQAGNVSLENYQRGIGELGKRFEALNPTVEASAAKISTFAEQASRNIQDALGDSILKTLEGDFNSIGQLWADLLKRMVAQALASRVSESLFGAGGIGSGGGIAGSFLSMALAGFRASGGPVSAGRAYMVGERGPEIMVPSQSGAVLPNGTGLGGGMSVVIHNVINGDVGPGTVKLVEGAMSRVKADILRSSRQGGAYAGAY